MSRPKGSKNKLGEEPAEPIELPAAEREELDRLVKSFLRQPAKRTCLKCGQKFKSERPDNRICDRCRKDNRKMTAGAIPCLRGLDETGL